MYFVLPEGGVKLFKIDFSQDFVLSFLSEDLLTEKKSFT
jgi:hypothetical protein